MDLFTALIAALGGYLIGAISFARIISRIAAPGTRVPDVAEVAPEGSDTKLVLKTISASSVSAHHGSGYGFMTYVLDVIKIVIPTLFFKLYFPDTDYYLMAAGAGVLGHVWPVYYHFRGGRGISAIYGGLFVIDWIGVFITSLGGMLLGLLVVRDVLTAYMAGVWLIIPWVWLRTGDIYVLFYAIFVNIIFMIAMIPESKQWIRIKREDKWDDQTAVLQLSGMGRGLVKMAKKLGIIKSGSTSQGENNIRN